MSSFRFLVPVVLLVVAPSCKRPQEAQRPQEAERPREVAMVSCGKEDVQSASDRSKEARECLWEHYRKGTSASLTSTARGADAWLTYTVRVVSPAVIEVRLDSHDKMADPSQHTSTVTCTGLRRVEKPGAAPGLTVMGCPAGVLELP